MKAIILAAGEGIRMRPLTLTTPKPLVKVGGKSLLERLVEKFPPTIDELIIVTGYLAEQIEEFTKNGLLGRKVTCVRQPKKMGTYDALVYCRPFLEEGEKFLLFFADDLIDNQIVTEMLKYDLAISVRETDSPRKFGIVALDENNFVVDIVEKPENPPSNLALANGYVLDTDIFNYSPELAPSGEYYLSVAAAKMAKNRKIKAVRANFWFPVGSPEAVIQAEEILKKETPTF
ncbi:MAG: nucleotidyltransferase family protein [bacterium]|nr:nucleotidyltransferase family protein [bacterium]